LRPGQGDRQRHDNFALNALELLWDITCKTTGHREPAELAEGIIRDGLNQPSDRAQPDAHSGVRQLLIPELHGFRYSSPPRIRCRPLQRL
jgi:hypothetical protein